MESRKAGNKKSRLIAVALHVCSEFTRCYTFESIPLEKDLIGIRVLDIDTNEMKDITVESAYRNIEMLNILSDFDVYTILFKGMQLGNTKQVCMYDEKRSCYIQAWPDGKIINKGDSLEIYPNIKVLNARDGDIYAEGKQLEPCMDALKYKEEYDEEKCRYLGFCLKYKNNDGSKFHEITDGKFLDLKDWKIVTLKSLQKAWDVKQHINVLKNYWNLLNSLHMTYHTSFLPVNRMACYNKNSGTLNNRYIVIARKTPIGRNVDVNSIEFYVGEKPKLEYVYSSVTVMQLKELCWLIENNEDDFIVDVYTHYNTYSDSVCIMTLLSVERILKDGLHPEQRKTDKTEEAERYNLKSSLSGKDSRIKISSSNVITDVVIDSSEFKMPEGTKLSATAIKKDEYPEIKKIIVSRGCSIEKKAILIAKELELHGTKAYSSVLQMQGMNVRCDRITIGGDITAKQLERMIKKFRDKDIRAREQLPDKVIQHVINVYIADGLGLSENRIINLVYTSDHMQYIDDGSSALEAAEKLTEFTCGINCIKVNNSIRIRFNDAEQEVHRCRHDIQRLSSIGGGLKECIEEHISSLIRLNKWLKSIYRIRDARITCLADDSKQCVAFLDRAGETTGLVYYKYKTDIPYLYIYKLSETERINEHNKNKYRITKVYASLACSEINNEELKSEWNRKNGKDSL